MEKGRADKFKRKFEALGLDPNAIYFAPSSPLMSLMQDADFDGDVMDIFDLISGQGDVTAIYKRVFERQ
jgi:hypothetical protein